MEVHAEHSKVLKLFLDDVPLTEYTATSGESGTSVSLTERPSDNVGDLFQLEGNIGLILDWIEKWAPEVLKRRHPRTKMRKEVEKLAS